TTLLFLSVFLSLSLIGQNVYIPDANFKACLVGNTLINTNGDTEIQVSEAVVYDGFIGCVDMNISDLTGIEAFTALTELFCIKNQLTSLDVSQNTSLTSLYCGDNLITSLDLSSNTVLNNLDCHTNQITSLDVSQNTSLASLSCSDNQLMSLDLSENTLLDWLSCSDNQLMSLDLSENTALMGLACDGNQLSCLNIANGNNLFFSIADCYFGNNPNLTCIEVDDANYSSEYWNDYIDPQASFSEDCNNDCSNTSSLTELSTSKNLIQILDLMGRETSFKPNTPLIYVYDDGSTERIFKIEE
ncbi:hypothetical protein N8Z75_02620, partial [Crocinitomicaceae bacterium]|nr:hypothetical protein [Crocinitomicaceae bacterium]